MDAREKLTELMREIEVLQAKVNRGEGGWELALARTKLQEVGYWLREGLELANINN